MIAAEFGRQVEASADPATIEPARIEGGCLVLPQRLSVAAALVPTAPLTPYVVSFTLGHVVRDEVRLFVIDLTEELARTDDPREFLAALRQPDRVEDLREVGDFRPTPPDAPVRPSRYLQVEASVSADDATRWRVLFSSEWRTRALLFAVAGSSAGPTWIDDFTVHELGAADVLALGPGEPESFDLPRPWANGDAALPITKVRCEWESRRALLLARDGAARCDFPLPTPPTGRGAGRLEFGLALVREERLCVRGPRSERVRVTWNGAAQEVALTLGYERPGGWHDLSLPLPAGVATGTLLVEYLGDGGSDAPLVALSDPLLFASDPAAAPAPEAALNVVFVSLDTFRADRLGRRRADGHSLTPRLDALAARSIRFERALANSSYTLPSHVSLFTSQRPGEHGMLTVFDALDPGRSANFTRRLAASGYATAAFTSGGMLNAVFCAIDDGFDRYGEIDALLSPDDRLREIAPLQRRPAYNRELAAQRRLDADVLPWLRAHRGAPFLLFLHTYLTHNYQPEPALAAEFTRGLPPTPLAIHGPAPYREQCNSGYLQSAVGRGDRRFSFAGAGEQELVPARDLPWFEALYDATVAQADREVGRVLDALDELGLAERTIVVVTSDHGEEFLEHGNLSHARTLHDEILRVPLLIHVPGMAPRVVADPVEHIDVAPTVLARLGLPVDPRMRGVDLLAPDREPRRITLHEGTGAFGQPTTSRAARTQDGKLILAQPLASRSDRNLASALFEQLAELGYLEAGALPPVALSPQFFDLALDPGEQTDLVDRARTKRQSIVLGALAEALAQAPFQATERAR